jgi:hypothetical protein
MDIYIDYNEAVIGLCERYEVHCCRPDNKNAEVFQDLFPLIAI